MQKKSWHLDLKEQVQILDQALNLAMLAYFQELSKRRRQQREQQAVHSFALWEEQLSEKTRAAAAELNQSSESKSASWQVHRRWRKLGV